MSVSDLYYINAKLDVLASFGAIFELREYPGFGKFSCGILSKCLTITFFFSFFLMRDSQIDKLFFVKHGTSINSSNLV